MKIRALFIKSKFFAVLCLGFNWFLFITGIGALVFLKTSDTQQMLRSIEAGLIGVLPLGFLTWIYAYQTKHSEIKERSQENAWATVIANNNLINIKTVLGLWKFGFWSTCVPDVESKQFYLTPASSDEELGGSVIAALLASKKIDFEENKGYYENERFSQLIKEYEAQDLERFCYKNIDDMVKDVLCCKISVKNSVITIQPWQKQSGEGVQKKPKIYDAIHVPLNGTPSEIGAALRTALAPKYAKPV